MHQCLGAFHRGRLEYVTCLDHDFEPCHGSHGDSENCLVKVRSFLPQARAQKKSRCDCFAETLQRPALLIPWRGKPAIMPCKTHLEPRTNASSDSPRPCNACTCVYKANVSRDLQQRQQSHKLPAGCQLLPAGLEPFGHDLKSSTRSPSPSRSPWASLGLRPLPRITLVSSQVGARYWRRKHCIGRRLLPAFPRCPVRACATRRAPQTPTSRPINALRKLLCVLDSLASSGPVCARGEEELRMAVRHALILVVANTAHEALLIPERWFLFGDSCGGGGVTQNHN